MGQPISGTHKALGKQRNVEAQVSCLHVDHFFLGGKEVDQQSAEAALAQDVRYISIPWTPTTTATSVREEHETHGALGDLKAPLEGDMGHGNPHQVRVLFEPAAFTRKCLIERW